MVAIHANLMGVEPGCQIVFAPTIPHSRLNAEASYTIGGSNVQTRGAAPRFPFRFPLPRPFAGEGAGLSGVRPRWAVLPCCL